MKTLLAKVSNTALDLLFPIPCAGCGREGKIICQDCASELAELTSPYCAKCASPDTLSPCGWCRESPPDVDGIRAPFLMEGTLKHAIHSFKYRGVRAAAPELGRLLAGYLAERPVPGDVLVPQCPYIPVGSVTAATINRRCWPGSWLSALALR